MYKCVIICYMRKNSGSSIHEVEEEAKEVILELAR